MCFTNFHWGSSRPLELEKEVVEAWKCKDCPATVCRAEAVKDETSNTTEGGLALENGKTKRERIWVTTVSGLHSNGMFPEPLPYAQHESGMERMEEILTW